jgi:hypothetical protein
MLAAYLGFLDGHKYLGYVVSLLPVIELLLVVTGGRRNPRFARTISMICKVGYRLVGGLVLFLGLALWHLNPTIGFFSGFIWVSILLWGGVEVASKRMVLPQCLAVISGETGSRDMVVGALIHLVCLLAITGLMTVRPF